MEKFQGCRRSPGRDQCFGEGDCFTGSREEIGSLAPKEEDTRWDPRRTWGSQLLMVARPPPRSLSLLCRDAFCQRAPIFLDYLHSILQKYPDGGQILKVRLQGVQPAGLSCPGGQTRRRQLRRVVVLASTSPGPCQPAGRAGWCFWLGSGVAQVSGH